MAQVDVVPDRNFNSALTREVYIVVWTPSGKSLSGTERGEDGWDARVLRSLSRCFGLESSIEVVVDGEETQRMSSQGEFSDRRILSHYEYGDRLSTGDHDSGAIGFLLAQE